MPYEEASSLPIHSVQAVETKNGKKEFHINILQTKSYKSDTVNWKVVTKAYLIVLQIKIKWKPNTAQFFVDITQRLQLIAVYTFIIYLFI